MDDVYGYSDDIDQLYEIEVQVSGGELDWLDDLALDYQTTVEHLCRNAVHAYIGSLLCRACRPRGEQPTIATFDYPMLVQLTAGAHGECDFNPHVFPPPPDWRPGG